MKHGITLSSRSLAFLPHWHVTRRGASRGVLMTRYGFSRRPYQGDASAGIYKRAVPAGPNVPRGIPHSGRAAQIARSPRKRSCREPRAQVVCKSEAPLTDRDRKPCGKENRPARWVIDHRARQDALDALGGLRVTTRAPSSERVRPRREWPMRQVFIAPPGAAKPVSSFPAAGTAP